MLQRPSATCRMLTSASLLLGKYIGQVALTTTDIPNILYHCGTAVYRQTERERQNSHIQRQWRMTETSVALMKLL